MNNNPENQLSQDHLEILHASAIIDSVITARGYRTVTHASELKELGFSPNQCRIPGLLIPVHNTDGSNSLYTYRPNNSRVIEDRGKTNPDGTHPNKVIKYEIPKGAGIRLDCPPICQPSLGNPSIPLWITEGQKKADALASAGQCAIALLGVWNFKGKNEFGATTFLADWDHIALQGRHVRFVFDSDVMTKTQVRQALDRLIEHLQRKGAIVAVAYLPNDPQRGKVGVDDWLAADHSIGELEALLEAPHLLPKPAPDQIELLDSAPARIERPLSLIEGTAYAATWLHVRVTRTETTNSKGEIIRYDPPKKITEKRLFIIRSDGCVFGDVNNPLENLPVEIHLPEIPQANKTWSARGVKAFLAGIRPDPTDVFNRTTDVIDRFIDFNRSLAPQRTMAEVVACYILATWFLDAFNVIGFLWPNGDRGSGKTHLLILVAELAYLGQLILASGTFATLRDLADYGATLAFDDAENISDPKSTDSDKRSLFLAGNRRGAKVPLKELGPDKTWHTRYVNAYCPRLFSATRIPDPILASRTIIIPLIRTSDRSRNNVDPLDYTVWPHDRQKLTDDLWALALEHLEELPRSDEWVGKNAKLMGRNLQPWRALLAVAAWLDSCGVNGLWQRMEELSLDYQNERPELEIADFTVLVLRSVMDWAMANVANVANATNIILTFTTASITDLAKAIAKESDSDIAPDDVTSQKVGQMLRKLRFQKPTRLRGQNSRVWKISCDDLLGLAKAYGIPVPAELDPDRCNTREDIGDIGEIGDIGNVGDIGDKSDGDSLYEGRL